MGIFAVHEIDPDVRVRVVRPMAPLAADLDAAVEAAWASEQARLAGALFNGRVFNADVITPGLICGHWTEFRRIVAQMRHPELHPRLGIRPLAVGGVIIGPDGVVIGRRPGRAVYQAGQWQLPPAGSVDPGAARAEGAVDLAHQVLIELQEEIGLGPDAVGPATPLCLVEHAASHVLDCGMALRTELGAAAILAAHKVGGNGEYDPLRVVAQADWPAFLAEAGDALVMQARVFLARVGWV